VSGDRPRLQQVLLNLIVNAWDAIGEYGELRISAHAPARSARDDGFPAASANAAPERR
jgi:signal transduction histidine kinase